MKPILQALLVADHVYVDAATNKKIVAGIFHRMAVTKASVEEEIRDAKDGAGRLEVPLSGHRSGSPFCYVSLTEIRGRQSFTLRYVNLDDDEAFFQTEFEANCSNPLETIEAVFPLPVLPVKNGEPGHYALELLWNQEPLGCHRITVVDATKQDT